MPLSPSIPVLLNPKKWPQRSVAFQHLWKKSTKGQRLCRLPSSTRQAMRFVLNNVNQEHQFVAEHVQTPSHKSSPLPQLLPNIRANADRVRHDKSKHQNAFGTFLCHVPGCRKGLGAGYSRRDKLREHLWKAYANMGHQKRVSDCN